MKARVANRVKVREKMSGSRIRSIRAIKKAANIMVTSRMETIMESLSWASLAMALSSPKTEKSKRVIDMLYVGFFNVSSSHSLIEY